MRRLFYDIETSPNIGMFWRAGRKQTITTDNIINERAIICICYKWQGEDEVYGLTWNKRKNDKSMLKSFVKVLDSADESIAHNGDRFDLPWIRTRALIHGIDVTPFNRTLDTLKKLRSAFYFNSNRLDYIGEILGEGRKIQTNYGMWAAITLNNDQEELAKMVDYCKEDVRLLERVYNRIEKVVPHNTHAAVLDGGYKYQCPSCGSDKVRCNKTRATAAGTIKHEMKCNNCRKYYTISNKSYMELLSNRNRGRDLLKYKM